MKNYFSYVRVSTKSQGLDGLGIAAQKSAVRRYIENQAGILLGEFEEVESGKKTDQERPQLHAALAICKKTKSVLIVSRLDRLSRNAAFLLSLQNAGVEFVCCDAPNVCKMTLGIIAILAQRERELISERTKAALQAAKARGVRLGCLDTVRGVALMNAGARKAKADFAASIRPVIEEIRGAGVSTLQGVADCLNRRGIATRTGKQWFPATVRNVLLQVP